jgi:hypothetical protein
MKYGKQNQIALLVIKSSPRAIFTYSFH